MDIFADGKAIAQGIARELSGPLGNRIREIIYQDSPFLDILPPDQARQCIELVYQGHFAGLRSSAMTEQVLKLCPSLDQETAILYVRAQSSLCALALIQARAENWGCPFYIWRCVKDERSSPAHVAMDGVLCRWDEKPAPEPSGKPFHPGCVPGCRCQARPVLDLEDIAYPVRAYHGGQTIRIPDETTLRKIFSL